MGKSTISMVIFNSYFDITRGSLRSLAQPRRHKELFAQHVTQWRRRQIDSPSPEALKNSGGFAIDLWKMVRKPMESRKKNHRNNMKHMKHWIHFDVVWTRFGVRFDSFDVVLNNFDAILINYKIAVILINFVRFNSISFGFVLHSQKNRTQLPWWAPIL